MLFTGHLPKGCDEQPVRSPENTIMLTVKMMQVWQQAVADEHIVYLATLVSLHTRGLMGLNKGGFELMLPGLLSHDLQYRVVVT